jgi:CRP-like cAMP-binding protein
MGSLLDLCGDLSQRSFAPGDVLLEEGATSGALYLLIEGEVEVLKGDFQVCTVREPGAIFGEISMLLGIPHTATVRAVTACRVHEVDQANAFLRSHKEITYELAELLAQRLHSMTTYLADLKRQYEDREDHLGMVDEVLETLTHQQSERVDVGSDRDPDPSIY